MDRKIVLKQNILDALSAVGMRVGQTVMVHCSLSALGYVCGGSQSVIEALLQAVGETGTINDADAVVEKPTIRPKSPPFPHVPRWRYAGDGSRAQGHRSHSQPQKHANPHLYRTRRHQSNLDVHG